MLLRLLPMSPGSLERYSIIRQRPLFTARPLARLLSVVSFCLAAVLGLAALQLPSGCSSSTPWLVQPPASIGDAVVVPSDIKPIFDSILALGHPGLPGDLVDRPLSERRAYMYYQFSEYSMLDLTGFRLKGQAGPPDWLDSSAQNIADRLSAQLSDDGETSDGIQMFFLTWPDSLTRGEIAWYGDWILLHYPSFLTVSANGSGLPSSTP